MTKAITQVQVKVNAGIKALDTFAENHMTIGVGSGSTVHLLLETLAQRIDKGLQVKVVAAAKDSFKIIQSLKIPTLNIDEINSVDICFDGADEIDTQFQMIKGGGSLFIMGKGFSPHSKRDGYCM
jgi:ribose 5-phosphate isomerase A